MQLQSLGEEKQRLQDRLLYHEYFHMSIFHELEIKLYILAPSINRVGQEENVKSPLQERLPPSKNLIDKEDSSHYSSSRQDGE
jgi:hypothetical protein